ncbi:MAG: glycosyltransferase, partial [Bacillota bacterium]
MIVRDEEAYLERCLNSVKDQVDEIVIVDTGSRDRTLELARHYTQKLYTYQ